MIAACPVVDLRGAPDFTHPDHEGVLQHAALVEVDEEGGPGGVELLHVGLVADEIVGVAVIVVMTDFHEGYPLLDELEGLEASAAEIGVAVTIFLLFPVVAEAEGFLRSHEAPGSFLGEPMVFEGFGGMGLGEFLL